jgi:hypothetical protein
VTNLARRVAVRLQARTAGDDRGSTTSELLMWIAGGVVIIAGLLARFTDIFNGVTDQVSNNLLGGG